MQTSSAAWFILMSVFEASWISLIVAPILPRILALRHLTTSSHLNQKVTWIRIDMCKWLWESMEQASKLSQPLAHLPTQCCGTCEKTSLRIEILLQEGIELSKPFCPYSSSCIVVLLEIHYLKKEKQYWTTWTFADRPWFNGFTMFAMSGRPSPCAGRREPQAREGAWARQTDPGAIRGFLPATSIASHISDQQKWSCFKKEAREG